MTFVQSQWRAFPTKQTFRIHAIVLRCLQTAQIDAISAIGSAHVLLWLWPIRGRLATARLSPHEGYKRLRQLNKCTPDDQTNSFCHALVSNPETSGNT